MPKKRGKVEPVKAVEPVEIQPGEGVDIHLARLESGEWYASIGAADDEEAIAFTAAWPWEALRGVAKQVKERAGELAAYRIAGEQECGRCEHATPDGRMCVVLQCPTGGAEAVASALQQFHAQVGDLPQASTNEIVRLYGLLKEPVLRGKGEEGHVLTATFEVTGDDLTPEFRYLTPSAKKQVAAFVYHAITPRRSDVPLGQRAIDFEGAGGNGQAEGVEALMCPVCEKEIHAEGQEPGMTCPLCENGLLEIVKRPAEGEANHEDAEDAKDTPVDGQGDEPIEGEAD